MLIFTAWHATNAAHLRFPQRLLFSGKHLAAVFAPRCTIWQRNQDETAAHSERSSEAKALSKNLLSKHSAYTSLGIGGPIGLPIRETMPLHRITTEWWTFDQLETGIPKRLLIANESVDTLTPSFVSSSQNESRKCDVNKLMLLSNVTITLLKKQSQRPHRTFRNKTFNRNRC